MIREKLTRAIEDYLKVIYDLCTTHGRASTSQIAEALNIKPPSVTGMLKKLSVIQPNLVEYHKHRGVVLTQAGERIALETIRHHRLLEQFLHEALGFPWDQIDAEADRLEHVISEEFEERMAEVLGNPTHDPHGDPIPSSDLTMPANSYVYLGELSPGQNAIIKRVRDTDPELLRYLSTSGIVPNACITVTDYSPFDDNISLKIRGKSDQIVLGPKITSQIFVEIE